MLSQYHKSAWSANGHPLLVPASFQDSDDEETTQSAQVPFDIHDYFGLPPGTPICLDSLRDPEPGTKPSYTYATLVKLAIWSSPQRRLTLSGIYDALEGRFPWFKDCENPNAWKTSIRHSLSLLSVFQKIPNDVSNPTNFKGHYWTVDFTKGDGYKRTRKRGKKPAKHDNSPQAQSETFDKEERVEETEPSSNTSTFSIHAYDMAPTRSRPRRASAPVTRKTSTKTVPNSPERQPKGSEKAGPYSRVPEDKFRHYRLCTHLYPEDGFVRYGGFANTPSDINWGPATTGNPPWSVQGGPISYDVHDYHAHSQMRTPSSFTQDIEEDSLADPLAIFRPPAGDGGPSSSPLHPSRASYRAHEVVGVSSSGEPTTWESNEFRAGASPSPRAHGPAGAFGTSLRNLSDDEENEFCEEGHSRTGVTSAAITSSISDDTIDPLLCGERNDDSLGSLSSSLGSDIAQGKDAS